MDKKTKLFFVLVVANATVLVLSLDRGFALGFRHAIGLAGFVAFAMFAETVSVEFGSGKPARSSLAFLPFLACIVVFAPIFAVIAAAAVSAFSTIVLARQQLLKALFNVSQAVLAAGLAAIVYEAFLTPETARLAVRNSVDYYGFFALECTFFAVNMGLAGIAISLIRRERLITILRQILGPRAGNLLSDLVVSPIAIIPAILYFDHFLGGVVIVLVPLLVLRYSYFSKLQIEEANRDLLKVLVKAIETRDPYTSGHSLRVAALSKAIAEDMRLGSRKADQIETAALLHDIGKIDSIYEAVIRKPHDLTDGERDLIKTHATKGADLLQSLSTVNTEVIKAVRHHHERYDGTGYPSGLRAEEIPTAARIIMMADSVDAMLSDRPYRRALSIGRVRSELLRCSGAQFDPAIVQIVLKHNTLERAANLVERPPSPELQIVSSTA